MKFTKMHGAGNDYIYIDCFTENVDNPEEMSRKLSDRHFGIGSDGLILIKRKIMPGRTTASVNGESVTARQLRELADVLLDIYGQRENQRLLQKNQQMSLLLPFLVQISS